MEPSSLLTEDVVWEMGAAAKTSATPPLYVGVKIGAIDETPEVPLGCVAAGCMYTCTHTHTLPAQPTCLVLCPVRVLQDAARIVNALVGIVHSAFE